MTDDAAQTEPDTTPAPTPFPVPAQLVAPPKKRMEPGKFLLLTGLLSAPLNFVIMFGVTIIAILPLTIVTLVFAKGNPAALTSTQSTSINLVVSLYATALSYLLLWAFPFVRRAMKLFGSLGLSPRVLKDRMGTRTLGGAVAKSLGVGTLVTAVLVGLELLAGFVLSHIPSLAWLEEDSSNADTTTNMLTSSLSHSSPLVSVLTLFASAILLPICEEFLFRGITAMSLRDSSLWRTLGTRLRTFLICLVSGLYFGLAHFQSDADIAVSLYTMIVMTIFGTVLTYIAAFKYRSLAPTMWAHVLNNFVSFI
jgi:membrane protease YdiL (CAAX protease family)